MTRPAPRRVGILEIAAVAVGVLVAAIAGAIAHSASATYQSSVVLAIDQPRAVAAAADSGIIDKLSRLRFKYVGLVGTDRLAAPVAAQLHLPITEVRGRLSASAQVTDLLVHVGYTAPAAGAAHAGATVLANALVHYVGSEQVAAGIPPTQRVVMSVVVPAANAVQVGPRRTRVLGVALVAGLLAGGLVLLVGRRRTAA